MNWNKDESRGAGKTWQSTCDGYVSVAEKL